MIDGNISMEEDTELRDLVVQTLENNGVLAKVRAELRASVFLALEEQESVMNPEPLLNKTVKQYLANSEGKLLFSLVREFLEYFGLEYTISVYDPETYFGKEYNYAGRSKLCEELGINSTEPLLGEILKNSMNGAFNNLQKNETNNSRQNKSHESSANFANATFEVSVPKVLRNDSVSPSNDNDSSEKVESSLDPSSEVPLNATDKEDKEESSVHNAITGRTDLGEQQSSLRESLDVTKTMTEDNRSDRENNADFNKQPTSPRDAVLNHTSQETKAEMPESPKLLNKSENLIKFDESVVAEPQLNQNEETMKQNNMNSLEIQIANNVQNKKQTNAGKTVYFEEIIIDGKKENVNAMQKNESFLEKLPALNQETNSIFGDLPPLNGKKTNISDLKELMDIGLAADGVDNYEEDFVSSASASTNEQSPSKEPGKEDSPVKVQTKKEDRMQSARSEDISEEIEEIDEILSSTSCLEDVNMDKNISNFTTGITADYIEEV